MEKPSKKQNILKYYLLTVAFFSSMAVYPIITNAELDKILAVVEEDVILESELTDQMSRVRNQIRSQGTRMPPAAVLERQVLERLVFEKIQLSVAVESGVEVSDKSLARALADIARKNNLSKDEFVKTITDEGYDLDYFRNQIRQEILIAKLRKNEIDKRIRVAPSEIDHYLRNDSSTGDSQEEFRLSHILVSIPFNASNSELKAAREKIETARNSILGGDDFSAVAISVSDSTNALEGGDLGWRKGTEIPSIFADSVSSMEKGELSNIITNSSGFHLIKLTDQRSGKKIMVEQFKTRHILLSESALLSKAGASRRISQIRLRLESGADFAELARTNSDDRTSALEGGDLGWVQRGKMVPEFEEVMLAAEIGEISAPFESEFGFHILQVLDKRMHDDTETVRRQKAREAIRRQKIEERRESWLRRLRDEAYVEYRVTL